MEGEFLIEAQFISDCAPQGDLKDMEVNQDDNKEKEMLPSNIYYS